MRVEPESSVCQFGVCVERVCRARCSSFAIEGDVAEAGYEGLDWGGGGFRFREGDSYVGKVVGAPDESNVFPSNCRPRVF